jgi:hypothetical protein
MDMTTATTIIASSTVMQETPAFTTASNKNTTTEPLVTVAEFVKSHDVKFPDSKDDVLEVFKEMLREEDKAETTTEYVDDKDVTEMTTVRIEIGENIVETTSRKIITASVLNRGNVETTEPKPVQTTTAATLTTLQEAEVVQVQAEGVNGPLNLDEAIYYDDPDADTNDVTTELIEDLQETTTVPITTVVNGFIVNKNQALQTLDNNGIETVRTGGDIMVELTTLGTGETISTTDRPMADETTVVNDEELEVKMITTLQSMAEEDEATETPIIVIDDAIFTDDRIVLDEEKDVAVTLSEETETTTKKTGEATTVKVESEEDIQPSQNSTEQPEKRPPSKYPITDLLNSIYRLVTGIRESSAAEAKAATRDTEETDRVNKVEIQYFDSPLAKPLNVHNARREPVPFTTSTGRPGARESVDLANSNTDPFQQLSAPDLTGFIPEGDRELNVQYIFAAPARRQEPARTLSPFNSDALRVEEPPKVLVQEVQRTEQEPSSFSLSSLLPSFFSSPADAVQVAGSLPVTVRDPAQQSRRPMKPAPASAGLLSSLFSRPTSRRPAARPRTRPLRPDVPSQGRFIPVVPERQRGKPVSITLPQQGEEAADRRELRAPSREDSGRMLDKDKMLRLVSSSLTH